MQLADQPRSRLYVSQATLVPWRRSLSYVTQVRPLRAIEFGPVAIVGDSDMMTNQLEGNFSYLKYKQTPNKHNVYLLRSIVFLHHVLHILHICFIGA